MNKFNCNHAVGFCKDGWLFYKDFVFNMNYRLYKKYNRHCAFEYCPICGKNLKRINRKIFKIKDEYSDRLMDQYIFRLECGFPDE